LNIHGSRFSIRDSFTRAYVDMLFHADLPAQEGSLFRSERGSHNVSPDPASFADFQFLGGNVAAYGSGDNYGIGADMLAGDPTRLTDHQQAAQSDIPIKSPFDPQTTAAAHTAF
jgi:hypothetical protein